MGSIDAASSPEISYPLLAHHGVIFAVTAAKWADWLQPVSLQYFRGGKAVNLLSYLTTKVVAALMALSLTCFASIVSTFVNILFS